MTFKKALLASIGTAALALGAGGAQADQLVITHHGRPTAQGMAPKFAMIRRLLPNVHASRAGSLPPTWVFSYTYSGKTYNETFIGTNSATATSTTVPVYIIPVKMTYGTTSYDPTTLTANGVSIVQNVLNSPLFKSSISYTQGSTAIGTTQYEDAFQKATLWGKGGSASGYHLLLGTPTVEPVQTITVPTKNGKLISAFGATNLILENINNYDASIQALITSLKIPSNALPLFVTTQTYLSSNNTTSGCCIGGYHSVTTAASQPYATASYITQSGAFSQNVSAFSHELGEWIDDPNTNNPVPAACGSGAVLEVGDPLEGNTNYGDYAYTVGGVTWDLQDLVLLPYFGAPTSDSINGWSTFQGETLAFCSNGG